MLGGGIVVVPSSLIVVELLFWDFSVEKGLFVVVDALMLAIVELTSGWLFVDRNSPAFVVVVLTVEVLSAEIELFIVIVSAAEIVELPEVSFWTGLFSVWFSSLDFITSMVMVFIIRFSSLAEVFLCESPPSGAVEPSKLVVESAEFTGCSGLEAADCFVLEPADCSVLEAAGCSVLEPADCSVLETADCTVLEPADCSVLEAPDCSVVEAVDCTVLEASECSVIEAADCTVLEAANCFVLEAADLVIVILPLNVERVVFVLDFVVDVLVLLPLVESFSSSGSEYPSSL